MMNQMNRDKNVFLHLFHLIYQSSNGFLDSIKKTKANGVRWLSKIQN